MGSPKDNRISQETPTTNQSSIPNDAEMFDMLTNFALETESKLHGAYLFIRETTPLNLIVFYGLLFYVGAKVLGIFGRGNVNGNANFTYKIVDESAQAAILQHIDSKQPAGTTSNQSAASVTTEVLNNLAELESKLARL